MNPTGEPAGPRALIHNLHQSLLSQALLECVADYLATLVTGEVPDPPRDAWARQRESWLWQEFQRDRQAIQADSDRVRNPLASDRFRRWFANLWFGAGRMALRSRLLDWNAYR